MCHERLAVVLLLAFVVSAAVLVPPPATVFRMTVASAAQDPSAVEAGAGPRSAHAVADSAGVAEGRLRRGRAGRAIRAADPRGDSPVAGGAGNANDRVSGRPAGRTAPRGRRAAACGVRGRRNRCAAGRGVTRCAACRHRVTCSGPGGELRGLEHARVLRDGDRRGDHLVPRCRRRRGSEG